MNLAINFDTLQDVLAIISIRFKARLYFTYN